MSKKKESTDNGFRVFISYGRKDASELARRLEIELTNRGFDVWLDTTELRGGSAWEQQIIDRLRETNVVVALLSPHSTRRDDAGSGDSVCLDELAWARYEPPPTPIVPVLAVRGASVPLTIFRLHYIDFADSLSSDSVFQRRLDELLVSINGVLAGHTKYRGWERWLSDNLDFDRFLYYKHRDFVGRDWLFEEIQSWRKTATESALLITGDPGIGKSAIVAELTFGRLCADVLATYCCQWDVLETLRPSAFVRTLAYQFAARIPEYAAQIETSRIREVLERAELDPPSALELGVLTPLDRLEALSGSHALLCIDALDEAVTLREGATIVNLLESKIERFPSWLRVIATTRREKEVLRQLGGLRAREIEAAGENNLKDLRAYVVNQFDHPDARAMLEERELNAENVIESVLSQCKGNFLYAEHFLQGVLRDRMQIDELGDLPIGLEGTYDRFFRRAFPTRETIDQIRPVLEVLCAADGPIPSSLLARAASLDERALIKLLKPLNQFLHWTEESRTSEIKQPSLSFWHKSVYDFLTAIEYADSEFGIDQTEGDSRLALTFVDGVLSDPKDFVISMPYIRKRGLDHLARCGRFFDGLSDEQVALLVSHSWGEGGFRAVGGLQAFARGFVLSSIEMGRLDAIDRLLDALNMDCRRAYIASGLIRVETQADGSESTSITGSATESGPLNGALQATEHAVWVVDQLLAQRSADSKLSAIVKKLDFMGYMAGGLDIASWAYELSGYFEDQGGALNKMIGNLRQGRRAQTWKH